MKFTPEQFPLLLKRLIRSLMARQGLTYGELSRQLYQQFGVTQLDNNLRSKVNKGKLSADLFIQILILCEARLDSRELLEMLEALRAQQGSN